MGPGDKPEDDTCECGDGVPRFDVPVDVGIREGVSRANLHPCCRAG